MPDDAPVRKKYQRNPLPRLFDRHQIKCLMAAVNLRTKVGYRDRAIMETLYRGGLRCSEICDLRMEDVKLEDGYLEIRNSKAGRSRVVPISPALAGWLWTWRDRRPDYADCPWFFPTLGREGHWGGNRMHRKKVWFLVHKYGRAAGIEGPCFPHMLRHTFATELLEEPNFTIKDVQDLLGHASLQTTEIYLHSRPAALREKMLARAMG